VDLRARQELNNGFGNALARAFELVVTPMIFIGLGYCIGSVVGARPVFTFAFGAFGVIGTIARMMLRYDVDMREQEERGPWSRQR
jgi:hypothetical protein